jgi:transposase
MGTCHAKKVLARGQANERMFEVINPDAAGIDVGASEMWVCVPGENEQERVRKFGTDTMELEAIATWLLRRGVKTVSMESTGVYWIPLFQILENHGLEACLVNARHVKNVPGRRKTDRLDCRWLQKLHACGLLSASFRPPPEICRLRTCLRHRTTLVQEQAAQIQRMQKAMREMNVQLDAAVSDVTGVSGMRIMDAIIGGEHDPATLARMADPRVRKSPEQIARCLQGDYRPEHLFVLRQALAAYRFFLQQIQDCDGEVERYTGELEAAAGRADTALPAAAAETRKRKKGNVPEYDVQTHLYRLVGVDLTRIPGIGELTAQGLISETGLDMSRWQTPKHFASWLDLCPSPKVSGGRVIGQGRRHASNRAAQMFRQAASSLSNSQSWLGSFYRRMRVRIGAAPAVKATAHKLALIYYHVLSTHTEYRQIEAQQYDQRLRERTIRNLQRRARQLGMDLVSIEASTEAATTASSEAIPVT